MKLVEAIVKLWKSIPEIVGGVKNYVLQSNEVELLAHTRMSICEECPLLDIKGDKCFAAGTQPCCGSCGCSLKLKTRSIDSACPEGKW